MGLEFELNPSNQWCAKPSQLSQFWYLPYYCGQQQGCTLKSLLLGKKKESLNLSLTLVATRSTPSVRWCKFCSIPGEGPGGGCCVSGGGGSGSGSSSTKGGGLVIGWWGAGRSCWSGGSVVVVPRSSMSRRGYRGQEDGSAVADSNRYRFFMDSILFLHWVWDLGDLVELAREDTMRATSSQSWPLSLARFRSTHLDSYASRSAETAPSLHSSLFSLSPPPLPATGAGDFPGDSSLGRRDGLWWWEGAWLVSLSISHHAKFFFLGFFYHLTISTVKVSKV